MLNFKLKLKLKSDKEFGSVRPPIFTKAELWILLYFPKGRVQKKCKFMVFDHNWGGGGGSAWTIPLLQNSIVF